MHFLILYRLHRRIHREMKEFDNLLIYTVYIEKTAEQDCGSDKVKNNIHFIFKQQVKRLLKTLFLLKKKTLNIYTLLLHLDFICNIN